MKRAALLAVFLFWAGIPWAGPPAFGGTDSSGAPSAPANAESVRLKSFAAPARVTLGGEIRLTLRVSYPDNYTVKPPLPQTQALLPFEIKKVETVSETGNAGRRESTFVLTLTVFELGELKIPPLELDVRDEKGHPLEVTTRVIPIQVVSVGNITPDSKLRPIKGPVSRGLGWLRWLLLGVPALALVVWLVVRVLRRTPAVTDPESLKPPHERVHLELERLQKRALIPSGKTQEHYSELSDILRRYLERRFHIEAFEHTTAETASILRNKNFDLGLIKRMREVLDNADLVKFAKFSPPRSLADTLAAEIAKIADDTKPEEPAEIKKSGPPR